MKNITLGQVAFEGYKNAVNNSSHIYGVIISDWDELMDLTKEAWEESAKAVIEENLKRELEEVKKEVL